MSARDDYPLVFRDAAHGAFNDRAAEATRALDEIDRLRAAIDYLTKNRAHITEKWGGEGYTVSDAGCGCCSDPLNDVPPEVLATLAESYKRCWP